MKAHPQQKGGNYMPTGLIVLVCAILILTLSWILTGNSHRVEGKQLRVRGGLRMTTIEIDNITSIYDTDALGPSRLNDGKPLLYVNTSYSTRGEIVFIKMRTDKNYVLSFDNPDYKQWIIDDILKVKNDIEVVKEF